MATQAIPDIVLSRLSDLVSREIGLQFPRERWRDLERGVVAAAREFGFDDVHECIRWLLSGPLSRRQIETLASTLTIGETYFFRDPAMLESLESEILPALVRERSRNERRLRIWSAGCSSGEEPYTLAILLHRLLPDLARWNITILATDVNRSALQKGIAASYGKWSFRATPAWFKSGYFSSAADGELRVIEEIRRMVSFEYLNLAEDSYPSLPTNTNAMDLILCRNVLMYFSEQTVRGVVNKLRKCLVDDGWLIVGAADLPAKVAALQPVVFKGTTCYRKSARQLDAADRGAVRRAVRKPLGQPAEQEQGAREPTATAVAEAEQKPGVASPAAAVAAADAALAEASKYYRRGLYREAAATLAPFADGAALTEEGAALLVRSYANQGKLAEGLAVCERALSAHKLNPSLHYLRAEILQEQGRGAEAREALLRALYLEPKLVMAHFALGNLFLWSGELQKSDRHYRNALELLAGMETEAVVPGSEGMTAGRLREIIGSTERAGRRAGGGA